MKTREGSTGSGRDPAPSRSGAGACFARTSNTLSPETASRRFRRPRWAAVSLNAATPEDADRPDDWHTAAQRNLSNRMIGQLYHCLQRGQRFDESAAFPVEIEDAAQARTVPAPEKARRTYGSGG